MPDTLPETQGQLLLMIGEIKGQLRELVHSINNQGQLLNNLTDKMSVTQNLPEKIKSQAEEIADLKLRVTALEAVENRRVGAVGLGSTLLRSPLIGWLAGAALAVWAFIERKHV